MGGFKGCTGKGKYDMAPETLYKSLTLHYTFFLLSLHLFRCNYGGKAYWQKCKRFKLFAWCRRLEVMVIRGHDGRFGQGVLGLLRILFKMWVYTLAVVFYAVWLNC